MQHIEDPPPCRHCGRCVFCGPPCCDGMAEDIKAWQNSPEYLELVRKQKEEGKRAKAERKAAKKLRRQKQLAERNNPPIHSNLQPQEK